MKSFFIIAISFFIAASASAQAKDTSKPVPELKPAIDPAKPEIQTPSKPEVYDKNLRREWKDIPEKVKASFIKRYPNGKLIRWIKARDIFMAEFEMFGKKQYSSFNKEGEEMN
ncbi:MAG: hypothetical protein K2X48_07415 [Chitinophagaceae bacterium]|nr:hypothetical protein [Chitinophagaceae bacterium]